MLPIRLARVRMPLFTANIEHVVGTARSSASWLSSLLFVVSMLGCAFLGGQATLVIYSLSFWHYYLYWLAYYFGAVSIEVFKRDAILMKTVSLMALGSVYFAAPLDFASLAVVAAGFLLNCVAARALGADRTYYGYEAAGLPPKRITAFPYSWISHPMLVGNIMAFGGTLIDADFRRRGWPLACAHVALNLGLLVMELAVTPQRRAATRASFSAAGPIANWPAVLTGCGIAVTGAALAVALRRTANAEIESGSADAAFVAAAGACVALYAYVLYRCYSIPRLLSDNLGPTEK